MHALGGQLNPKLCQPTCFLPLMSPTSQQTNQTTNQLTPAGRQETKAGARNGCKYCSAGVEMFKIPSGRPLPCRWSKAVNISPVGNHDSPPRPRPRGNNLFKAFSEIPAKYFKNDSFAGLQNMRKRQSMNFGFHTEP